MGIFSPLQICFNFLKEESHAISNKHKEGGILSVFHKHSVNAAIFSLFFNPNSELKLLKRFLFVISFVSFEFVPCMRKMNQYEYFGQRCSDLRN